MYKFFVFMLTIFVVMPTTAQNRPESRFITQSFFSDGVEIITIYPIADNQKRLLHIYDDGDWLHLSYPDAIETLWGKSVRDVYIPYFIPDESGWIVLTHQNIAWRVYKDGSFSEHYFPCNPDQHEIYNYMYSGGEIAWIYTYVDGKHVVCNMTTNEISPELPAEDSWGPMNFEFQVPIAKSANGRYLILLANAHYTGVTEGRNRFHAYSYDTQMQIFRFLGSFGRSNEELVNVGMWLSDTVITFSTDGMPEWSVIRYYTADVTQNNSLELLSSSLVSLSYNQQNQNFEQMPSDFHDGVNIGPCYIQIYHVIEHTTYTYYTGNLCDRGFIIPSNNNERLYRSVIPYASIVRLNLTTGERHNIFIGEVEEILSVSPQGAYALINLGRNGVVDINSDPFDPKNPYRFIDFSDTFTTYILQLSDGYLLTSVPHDAKWLSDNYLYTQNRLLVLHETQIETIPLDGTVIDKLANGEQLAIQTNNDEFILYTASNGTITPIIPDLKGYTIHFYEPERNVLLLSLNHSEETLPDFSVRIRLPD